MKPVKYGFLLLPLASIIIFFLYLSTMHPVFKNNDSPETTTAAYTLGICHPPGYPLHAIAGKVATMIPAGNPAFRMNLFSALLALMVMVITLAILKEILFRMSIPVNINLLVMYSMIILLSYMMWQQGTEAKGGIYMLNLAFFGLMILFSVKIMYSYEKKFIYLGAFILGLSMANHWPSMIITIPVFAGVLIYKRKQIQLKIIYTSSLFFLLGLTPYFYLYIRSTGGALLNWGAPDDLKSILWVILRKGYLGPVDASLKVFSYQAGEFISLFVNNYIFLWPLVFAGGYYLYKRAKQVFWLMSGLAFMVVFMVVVYNRTEEGVKWLLKIFLMPAEYVFGIFIIIGFIYIAGLLKGRLKSMVHVSALILLVVMAFINYSKNDFSRNFLSYDYGNNILMTMEKDSVYMGEGDYNLMPVYYIQNVQKRRQDVLFVTGSFMIFQWGIDQFNKKYEVNIPMTPYRTEENLENIINYFNGKRKIYRSNYFPRLDNIKEYTFSNKGIVMSVNKKQEYFSPAIYRMYTYRNIFDRSVLDHKTNIDLVGWYPVSMVNQANLLSADNRHMQSIELYDKALLFPNDKPAANINYNAAMAYKALNDNEMQLKYLRKAIEADPDMLAPYEQAGIIYYNMGIALEAKNMFENAVRLNSSNEYVRKGLDVLSGFKGDEILELTLVRANEHMNKNELREAEPLYKFLLDKKYKTAIIYRNLGVFHFKTKNYAEALENYKRSENETPNAQVRLYVAYTYYVMGDMKNAVLTAEEGLKKYPGDKALLDFYSKMKSGAKQ